MLLSLSCEYINADFVGVVWVVLKKIQSTTRYKKIIQLAKIRI